MNIGIDINSLLSPDRTGVGEFLSELLQALFQLDKKNQYFLFSNSWQKKLPEKFWDQKNVHFIHTRIPNKLFHAAIWIFHKPLLDKFLVREYKRKNQIDIGHLDIWFSPNIGFLALSPRCKKLLMLHDLSFALFPCYFSGKMQLWHWFLRPRQQCKKADELIVPSENTKRDVIELYGIAAEKIQVVSPGLSSVFGEQGSIITNGQRPISLDQPLALIKEKYSLPEEFILFLGTIEPRKNIESLIEAYKQSLLFTAHYSLVIAGALGWKYKSILKKIQQTPGVQYIGYVDAEDKPWLYSLASVFAYPSFYEGFGLPVLEAMALGVPVVTSNRSSLPEITNGAASLVDPHNIEDLKVGLERILLLENFRQDLKEKGRAQASVYNWKLSAQKFLQLLNEL